MRDGFAEQLPAPPTRSPKGGIARSKGLSDNLPTSGSAAGDAGCVMGTPTRALDLDGDRKRHAQYPGTFDEVTKRGSTGELSSGGSSISRT
jgi:hypothetical protein